MPLCIGAGSPAPFLLTSFFHFFSVVAVVYLDRRAGDIRNRYALTGVLRKAGQRFLGDFEITHKAVTEYFISQFYANFVRGICIDLSLRERLIHVKGDLAGRLSPVFLRGGKGLFGIFGQTVYSADIKAFLRLAAVRREGAETVQLYIRDRFASISRPIKELRGFKKVKIKPGETVNVAFSLTVDDFRFYNEDLDYVWEPGKIQVFIGRNSNCSNYKSFELAEN